MGRGPEETLSGNPSKDAISPAPVGEIADFGLDNVTRPFRRAVAEIRTLEAKGGPDPPDRTTA